MKDSQDKYVDVVRKLDVHFTPKKNLSHERYTFKIFEQKPDEDCSAHITCLKRMGKTVSTENLTQK